MEISLVLLKRKGRRASWPKHKDNSRFSSQQYHPLAVSESASSCVEINIPNRVCSMFILSSVLSQVCAAMIARGNDCMVLVTNHGKRMFVKLFGTTSHTNYLNNFCLYLKRECLCPFRPQIISSINFFAQDLLQRFNQKKKPTEKKKSSFRIYVVHSFTVASVTLPKLNKTRFISFACRPLVCVAVKCKSARH